MEIVFQFQEGNKKVINAWNKYQSLAWTSTSVDNMDRNFKNEHGPVMGRD